MIERTIPARTRAAATGRLFTSLAALVLRWPERARQRRALAQLDDLLLRDIGLDRVDLAREIVRPPRRW